MSQDTEDLAARLAALEATGDKKRGAARPSPLAAILGVAGIVAVGGLAWAALQPSPEAPLPTAAPEEFQTTGSGFGDLAPMPVAYCLGHWGGDKRPFSQHGAQGWGCSARERVHLGFGPR